MALKATDAQVVAAYTKTGSVWKAAEILGMCGQSVHERIKKLGFQNEDKWQEWQLDLLKKAYSNPLPMLDELAKKIGKQKGNICRKAREFGWTTYSRDRGSKYNIPKSGIKKLFEEWENSQPMTITEFAKSRGYWSFGLMKIFRNEWPQESARIIRERYMRKDFVLARFRKRYKIVDSGCWEWQGARFRGGYGRFYALGENKAHRVSFILHSGEIPVDKMICHHCDNPPCVNPDHIYAGTGSDNVRDSYARGRARWSKKS